MASDCPENMNDADKTEEIKSSATVVRCPVDKSCHFLSYADTKKKKKKLAFEKRFIYSSKGYTPCERSDYFKGTIDADSQMAAVLQGGMVRSQPN